MATAKYACFALGMNFRPRIKFLNNVFENVNRDSESQFRLSDPTSRRMRVVRRSEICI
jgi:hypothetical protein